MRHIQHEWKNVSVLRFHLHAYSHSLSFLFVCVYVCVAEFVEVIDLFNRKTNAEKYRTIYTCTYIRSETNGSMSCQPYQLCGICTCRICIGSISKLLISAYFSLFSLLFCSIVLFLRDANFIGKLSLAFCGLQWP